MSNLFNNFNSGFHKRAAEILGPAMDKRALDTASQYALATALGGGAGALGGYYLTPEEEEENQTRNALLGALAGAGGGAALNYGLTRGAPVAPPAQGAPVTNVTPVLTNILNESKALQGKEVSDMAQKTQDQLEAEKTLVDDEAADTEYLAGEARQDELREMFAGIPAPASRVPVPVETYLGEGTDAYSFFGPKANNPNSEGYVDPTTRYVDGEGEIAELQRVMQQIAARKKTRDERQGELDDAMAIGRDLENNPRFGRARGAIDAREDRLAGEAKDEAARLASEELKATREAAAKARIQADLDRKNKQDAAVAAAVAQRAAAAAQRAAAEAALDKAVKNYPK